MEKKLKSGLMTQMITVNVLLKSKFLKLQSLFLFANKKNNGKKNAFSSLNKAWLNVSSKIAPATVKHDKKKVEDKKEEEKCPKVESDIGCLSDVGKTRRIDEDSVFVAKTYSLENGKSVKKVFMVIADGMGGHSKGEVASALGVTTVAGLVIPKILMSQEETDYSDLMTSSIKEANQHILQHSVNCPECDGMGTTMTMMVIDKQNLYVGHVGDSRAYIVSGGQITQITKDHSLVQQLVDNGQITSEEARNHPQKNVITRVVGYYAEVEPDVYSRKWEKNDWVIICCDGLTNHVEDTELMQMVLTSESPQNACKNLVKTANDRGGKDNISVIVTPPLGSLFEQTD